MSFLVFKEDIIPEKEELVYLYNDVGWHLYTNDSEHLIKSIRNSLKVITVWDNEELIGLIRVVGDGYSIIYIQDILVLKRYQNRGIGSSLIYKILDKYKKVRQKILLTDNIEKTNLFYKKVGFEKVEELGCIAYVKLN